MPAKEVEPKIPRFGIKIVRSDNIMKLTVGRYSIALKPLPNTTQTYDFVVLEQFITKTATLLYNELIAAEQKKQAFRKSFTDTAEENNDQQIVKRLLDGK